MSKVQEDLKEEDKVKGKNRVVIVIKMAKSKKGGKKLTKKKIKELKKYNTFLKLFCNADSETRSKAIAKMDSKCLSILCECTLNVLKNRDLTNDAQKDYLRTHFQQFRPQLLNLTQTAMPFEDRKQLCHHLRNCIGCMISVVTPAIDQM